MGIGLAVMEMDWMWMDLDGYPPKLVGCGWMWMDVVDIHFHPFIKRCFMGFLGGLESMYEVLEW
jgi:hypothetical protein